MMAFLSRPKLGPKTMKKPPSKPTFVRGSRPSSLSAPSIKPLNTRDYGKQPPITETGFGTTGLDRES